MNRSSHPAGTAARPRRVARLRAAGRRGLDAGQPAAGQAERQVGPLGPRLIGEPPPHLGGPLGEGVLWKGELECPWHHFRYDLETDRNTYPANVYPDDLPQLQADLKPLKTYAVKVERGRILVSLGATNDC